MTAPIAQTVHPGNGVPPVWRKNLIADWLTQNGINPAHVTPDDPIRILTVPYRPATPDGEGPWLIQVIVLTQYYVNGDEAIEANLITGRPVAFQRTVPLAVPFPPEPTTDGGARGQEQEVGPVEEDERPSQHQGGPQEDEQQAVRPSQAEEVPHRRPGSRPQRARKGRPARLPVAEEGRTEGRHQEVPQPETEEVAP